MTTEQIRKQIVEKYPPGTRFKPVSKNDSSYPTVTVDKSWDVISSFSPTCMWFEEKGKWQHKGFIYCDGKWAEIVSSTGASLIKEAKQRYPIGTEYTCATGGRTKYTVREQSFEYIQHTDQVYGEIGKGCLYDKGKWAPITNVVTSITDNLLELDEHIVFPLINGEFVNYAVRHAHLGNTDNGNNNYIFWYLGIKDYHAFCSKVYGYESSCGDFPSYIKGDMVAATKIVKEIMRLCEQKILEHLKEKEPSLITVDPIAMWLPQTGAVSLHYTDEQALKLAEHHLSMTRTKNYQETMPVKRYQYLVWNASHYWYAHKTTKELFTLKLNSINKQSNEKHTSSESTKQSRAAILQSSNLKIGQGSTSRGVGLKSSVSKIRLGNHGSNYQERLSYS